MSELLQFIFWTSVAILAVRLFVLIIDRTEELYSE